MADIITEKHPDLDELSITGLFKATDKYVIPIYQRNYAWGATEVEQLIQDIYDAAKLNKLNKADAHYFIGSLVVNLRDNGQYEIIDGQQRHTTLSILLALMKNIKGDDKEPLSLLNDKNLAINLHFDSRPKSARTLHALYNNETCFEVEEPAILAAYDIAEDYITEKAIDLKLFSQYLLNKVKILRVKVPVKTDLNHYFEIMNNRGEQLEKHEILKARFMAKVGDIKAQTCFAIIWDACADMSRYVQLGFDADIRSNIFGNTWSTCPSNFDSIKSCFKEKEKEKSTNASQGEEEPEDKNAVKEIAFSEIIQNREYNANIDNKEKDKSERFNSVIDFPNFLLQVLRVNNTAEISLDDKRLIDTFTVATKELNITPSDFIMQLLKCRMLFDRYIIKRDNNENEKWCLLSLVPGDSGFSYPNSVGKEEEDKINSQLIMILSMFHVSYPTMTYKNWLSGALKLLLELAPTDEINVTGEKYLEELELLSDRFFEGITGINQSTPLDTLTYKTKVSDEKNEVESIEVKSTYNHSLHRGTGVQNFVFNRLDYLLWQKLRSGYKFEDDDTELGIKYIKDRADNFKFSFRTSVEHYFPQTDPWGNAPMDGVDRFGNLCLITPSSNSKLSNWPPELKKGYYRDQSEERNESLKQAFMMSYNDWSVSEQGLKNIKSHEEMMIKVLCKR